MVAVGSAEPALFELLFKYSRATFERSDLVFASGWPVWLLIALIVAAAVAVGVTLARRRVGFATHKLVALGRATDAADRGAARARVAARARDADAASAGELGRGAARHVGQHALRRRHALAPARGGRRAVRRRAARSQVELQRELVFVRRRRDRVAVARASAGAWARDAHWRRAARACCAERSPARSRPSCS